MLPALRAPILPLSATSAVAQYTLQCRYHDASYHYTLRAIHKGRMSRL